MLSANETATPPIKKSSLHLTSSHQEANAMIIRIPGRRYPPGLRKIKINIKTRKKYFKTENR